MANYLTKGKTEDRRTNFYTGEDEEQQTPSADEKYRPVGTGSHQFVPVDVPPGGASQKPAQPGQPAAPVFSNDPTPVDKLSEILNSPLASLPSFQRAMEVRNKRIALEAMPTYVNKKGETVQGLQDHNGRLRSGLKALLLNAAHMNDGGPARDWGDFGARLSGTIAAGATGIVVPEWDEWRDRQVEIEKLKQQETEAMKQGEFESKMLTGAVNRADKVADNQRQQKSLDDRMARHALQNLNDGKKMVLDPILKRGYYYEGDNPQEDEALANANIVLPDFDRTRKPINDNGQKKAWNPETRQYEPLQGTEVDPDDVPMTFSVDGQKITASAKNFLNYAGAKERQQSQQTFQAGENEKNRQVQYAKIKQQAEQFKAKSANEVVARKTAIAKALSDGSINQSEANELLNILKANNQEFFQE